MSSSNASQHSSTTLHVGLFWAAFALFLIGLRQAPILLEQGLHVIAVGSALIVVSLALVAQFLRRERRSFADIGMTVDTSTLGRFLGGMLIGILIVVAMLAIIIGLSPLRIASVASPDYGNAIGFSLAILFVLAYMEEIAFRSFPLVRLQQAWGIRTAIYVTSVAFALYHGPDPMNLLGPGAWGLLYGLAAVASRGISLPLGIHLGANWTQGLFEMKTQFASGLWQLVPGPMAGHIAVAHVGIALQVVLLVVGVVLIELYIRRRSNRTVTELAGVE